MTEAETLQLITGCVNDHIDFFHTNRLAKITKLNLHDILKRKNPYLFRAKNLHVAQDLTASLLDAYLSSSEEELFGQFLEGLAIYVAEITSGGHKSSTEGLDLELTREGVRYLVAIKSGPHWGNRSQCNDLRLRFKTAVRVLKQSSQTASVQPVLGICYGKFKTVNNGEYLKIGGQSFWHFVSGFPNLYIDMVEPIGYEAQKHDACYLLEKSSAYNRFTRDLIAEFCNPQGQIDWARLVRFNSGNLPAARG